MRWFSVLKKTRRNKRKRDDSREVIGLAGDLFWSFVSLAGAAGRGLRGTGSEGVVRTHMQTRWTAWAGLYSQEPVTGPSKIPVRPADRLAGGPFALYSNALFW